MTLSEDDIMDASLLEATEEECSTSLTSEEEAILLGKEVKSPKDPSSLPECPKMSELVESAK